MGYLIQYFAFSSSPLCLPASSPFNLERQMQRLSLYSAFSGVTIFCFWRRLMYLASLRRMTVKQMVANPQMFWTTSKMVEVLVSMLVWMGDREKKKPGREDSRLAEYEPLLSCTVSLTGFESWLELITWKVAVKCFPCTSAPLAPKVNRSTMLLQVGSVWKWPALKPLLRVGTSRQNILTYDLTGEQVMVTLSVKQQIVSPVPVMLFLVRKAVVTYRLQLGSVVKETLLMMLWYPSTIIPETVRLGEVVMTNSLGMRVQDSGWSEITAQVVVTVLNLNTPKRTRKPRKPAMNSRLTQKLSLDPQPEPEQLTEMLSEPESSDRNSACLNLVRMFSLLSSYSTSNWAWEVLLDWEYSSTPKSSYSGWSKLCSIARISFWLILGLGGQSRFKVFCTFSEHPIFFSFSSSSPNLTYLSSLGNHPFLKEAMMYFKMEGLRSLGAVWKSASDWMSVREQSMRGLTMNPQMRPRMEIQLSTFPMMVPILILVMVSCDTLSLAFLYSTKLRKNLAQSERTGVVT